MPQTNITAGMELVTLLASGCYLSCEFLSHTFGLAMFSIGINTILMWLTGAGCSDSAFSHILTSRCPILQIVWASDMMQTVIRTKWKGNCNLRHSPSHAAVIYCSCFMKKYLWILSSILQKVDVPVMLQRLRDQRMFLIQTIAQYKFVYQVLILFLQNSRLI